MSEIETIEIINERGQARQYETVQSRVKRFRDEHPDWSVKTTIVHINADSVVVKAELSWITMHDTLGVQYVTLASGHAEEWRASSDINLTSALENAETSAIGRALAALGYIATDSFASHNEVQRSIAKKQAVEQARPGALILLQQASEEGRAALRECWERQLSKPDRLACKNDMVALKARAAAVDSELSNDFEARS